MTDGDSNSRDRFNQDEKHTPGPWEVVRSQTCGHLRAAHNYNADPCLEWTDADLDLIQGSTDLLSAAESAIRIVDLWMPGPECDPDEGAALLKMALSLRLSIAKAKGEVS